MFKVMDGSSGNVLGLQPQGKIEKQDYAEMIPKVEALVQEFKDVRMLCDMSEFKTEAPSAMFADMKFGNEFRHNIVKMAIVGDKRWEEWITKLSAPFYAREAKYFHTADLAKAWEWVRS
ncbi:MAG: STAS/SEC14 domain-containing protein [Anaerolineales bacterium]|nr:STAS/SEC14 domain-containing protein [Anaerolineales bacterium]